MNNKGIIKLVKDGMITGLCTALCGYVTAKICSATDGLTDKVMDTVNKFKPEETLEDFFEEE